MVPDIRLDMAGISDGNERDEEEGEQDSSTQSNVTGFEFSHCSGSHSSAVAGGTLEEAEGDMACMAYLYQDTNASATDHVRSLWSKT